MLSILIALIASALIALSLKKLYFKPAPVAVPPPPPITFGLSQAERVLASFKAQFNRLPSAEEIFAVPATIESIGGTITVETECTEEMNANTSEAGDKRKTADRYDQMAQAVRQEASELDSRNNDLKTVMGIFA
ncbi:hypothetical protein HY967_05030 [Candidatus Jorgensenbacteria bacterium]|nr:hypothetical protein [Candidatus Jorgensenbacteria bacterium]